MYGDFTIFPFFTKVFAKWIILCKQLLLPWFIKILYGTLKYVLLLRSLTYNSILIPETDQIVYFVTWEKKMSLLPDYLSHAREGATAQGLGRSSFGEENPFSPKWHVFTIYFVLGGVTLIDRHPAMVILFCIFH